MSTTDRIIMLKRQRSHLVAYGATEKVKAVDLELAQLRRQRDEASRPRAKSRAKKPAAQMETATEDTSSVETATVRRSSRRKSD